MSGGRRVFILIATLSMLAFGTLFGCSKQQIRNPTSTPAAIGAKQTSSMAVRIATSAKHPAAEQSMKRQIEAGRTLFESNCAVCHGIGGTGGRGPNLHRPRLPLAPTADALRALITSGIPPEMPPGTFLTSEDVTALVGYVRSLGQTGGGNVPGDPARGARVFAQSGCPACHILAGKGTGYGPDLTDIGDRRSAAYLRQIITDPSAHRPVDLLTFPADQLPKDYLLIRVVTARGQRIEGIRVNEDDFTIQVRDAAGNCYSFDKSDLKSLQRFPRSSPMPSFAGILTEAQLQDLIAYLVSPHKEP